MKNKILFSLFLLCHVFSSYAQINLVPNPSFEDTIMCPDMLGEVTRARYWHDIENTPDYFHSCSIYPQQSVPNNAIGYQYAASGEAYCGFYSYSSVQPNYRECIGAFLLSPLTIGIKYFITFKINFARKEPISLAGIASNKIGILFSSFDYLTIPPPHNNFAQIYTDSIVTDTANWTIIRGYIVADSSYTFISIGNFFDDLHTDTIQYTGFSVGNAYYFIDDICVSDDSLYSEFWTSLIKTSGFKDIVVFPNPSSNFIIIDNIPLCCISIQVYDINGKLVRYISNQRLVKSIIDISTLPVGPYSIFFSGEKYGATKTFIRN